MLGSYICRRCRAHLSQRAPLSHQLPQHGRATFISLSRNGPPSEAPQSSPQEHAVPKPEAKLPRLNRRASRKEIDTQSPSASRYAKYTQNPSNGGLTQGEPFVQVSEPAVEYQPRAASTPSPTSRRPAIREEDIHVVWNRFLQERFSKVGALRENTYFSSAQSLYKLCMRLTKLYVKGESVPVSPAEALLRMAQLSLLDRVLGQTIRELTVALLLRGSGTVSSGPDTDALLSELLAVWKLAFQCRAEDSTTVQAIDEHWHLPADAERRSLTEPRDFTERFAKYLKGAQNYHSMADSAIALFSILKANSGYGIEINQSLRDQAAPLVHFLAGMVCNADMRRTLYLHERSMAPYREDLPIKYQQLLVEDISSAPLEGSILATKADGNQEEQLLKRISRAVQEHTHKDRLARLWQEVLGIYTTGESRTTIPVPIYNAFLSGFLELYAGDASLQVWNHMIAQGVKPDVTSWTALLSGCGKARDLDGLNIMWERMMRSGVQPDVYAWTARIHGLISLRQITAGFAAMDEMGRRWLASAQSSSAAEQISKKKQGRTDSGFEAPKPTTEVVNGAISAVADIGNMPFSRKTEHAHKILRWAGSLSIPPDARTYNILIQIYLRGQDLATALNLLEQMERDGLEPDIVTYTMLIGASFDNQEFHGLSPPEQTARVTELFSRLEARGLKLNSWTYSSTIDKLLKRHGNMSAVRVIVDHMMSRGISPTVHIYTSLITYYFQQSPPDIESVDSLWFQLNERPGAVADRVLFDRIVEGYASVGEIGKMMAVLTKMSALGKLPSWVTLTAVVKALVAAGEWERARGVVRDVQNGEGVAKGGMRVPTHGMQEFRSTVYKYGLVDSDLELEGPTGHGGIGGESGFSGVQG